jgi:hypothetical protein
LPAILEIKQVANEETIIYNVDGSMLLAAIFCSGETESRRNGKGV